MRVRTYTDLQCVSKRLLSIPHSVRVISNHRITPEKDEDQSLRDTQQELWPILKDLR